MNDPVEEASARQFGPIADAPGRRTVGRRGPAREAGVGGGMRLWFVVALAPPDGGSELAVGGPAAIEATWVWVSHPLRTLVPMEASVRERTSEGVGSGGPVVSGDAVERLEREVARVAGVRNAADAQLVGLVAEALGGGLWQGDGVHTPVQWLMWRAGLERSTARRIVGLARRAAELPVTMGAFSEGRLSLDQAAKVARFTPAPFEASVCELAESATVAQIARATCRYGFDAAVAGVVPVTAAEPIPEAPDPASEDEVERSVTFGTDEAAWWARVRLPVEEGLVVQSALGTARERLHREDVEARVSWADALVGMANTTLAHDAIGAERAARTHVLVHLETGTTLGPVSSGPMRDPLGAGDLVGRASVAGSMALPSDGLRAAVPVEPGGPVGTGWVASVHRGPVLPASVRRFVLCDADVQVVRLEDGRPIEVGRVRRTPSVRLRRLVEHRDHGCRVPGCDRTLWVQVHHIRHWEDGGPTESWNLCCLCPFHHRLHHRGHLGITGNADGVLTFTDRSGRRLASAGKPRPPGPEDTPRVPPYQGPTGERLDPRAVHFTPTRAGPTAA
ncbi:MAG TPA: DUF222 domain-containing protein [Acidimicrobiales bacterium]|nr:DUF222 domain-containing protein [Acidimicrobiales bacterium]